MRQYCTAQLLPLASGLGGSKSAGETELSTYAIDAVGRVEVLDHDHLVAGCATLARGDGRVGQEDLPCLRKYKREGQKVNVRQDKTYAEPSFAELGLDLLSVAEPVPVPPPESSRVVNTNSVNAI
jgi:hypothetical protein